MFGCLLHTKIAKRNWMKFDMEVVYSLVYRLILPIPKKLTIPVGYRVKPWSAVSILPYMLMLTYCRKFPGSRFALCEMKVMVFHLLLHFKVSPAEKTRIPVKLEPGAVLLTMEGGHWVRLKSRM